MPLDIKHKIQGGGPLSEAARRRASDEEHRSFSARELDERTARVLQRDNPKLAPNITGGQRLNSFQFREFLKDSRYVVGALAGQSDLMEMEINNLVKTNLSLLDDIQRDAREIESGIVEEEIKATQSYSQVHYNSFARPKDANLPYDDKSWIVDPKLDASYLADNIASVFAGSGVTLPVREQNRLFLKDVSLVSNETDFGDSEEPIQSTPARNLLLPNKTFRHVIIKKDFDETSRLYDKSNARCTFLLTLPSLQMVNYLEIRPAGSVMLQLDSIVYLDENGAEVTLTSTTVNAEGIKTLLFEPLRTRYIKISFIQNAPVGHFNYISGDPRVQAINENLRGVGFSQLLNESSKTIEGRVFDFSMEEIRLGLRTYGDLGVFRSRPVDIEAPVGLSITDVSEAILVSSDQHKFGREPVLPGGEAYAERYAGITLTTPEGGVALEELIPVPDSYPTATEWLPLKGRESRVKCFPNLMHGLVKTQVESAVWDSGAGHWVITTYTDHGFANGVHVTPSLGWMGPTASEFNGTSTSFTVYSTTLIHATPDVVPPAPVDIDAGTQPFSFVYRTSTVTNPLTVKQGTTTLSLGTDYTISLDDGNTWHSEIPVGQEFTDAMINAQAGHCRVRITAPDYDSLYWISYPIARNQKLSKSGLVNLKNGNVVFDESLRETKGTVNTVFVIRSQQDNPYITPVLKSYSLKVREDVS